LSHMAHKTAQLQDDEWVKFPGGELEGKRPKALCPACREHLKRAAAQGRDAAVDGPAPSGRTLCFQCYRAELDRNGALKAAGELDTASNARFQDALPFEPVNQVRLQMLKAERGAARTALHAGIGQYTDRRRQAQIAARHALQAIAAGLQARQLASAERGCGVDSMAAAIHAAELQLPESWLPFVVAR
jgi:hypothetical protein